MTTDSHHEGVRMSTHRDVVIIGAGQAGLAIGYHLARQGRDFTILEAAPELGSAWRSRWDSLKLFTPARYDGLPGRDFPGPPDSYPTRDEVVDYLTAYARDFDLPGRTEQCRARTAKDQGRLPGRARRPHHRRRTGRHRDRPVPDTPHARPSSPRRSTPAWCRCTAATTVGRRISRPAGC